KSPVYTKPIHVTKGVFTLTAKIFGNVPDAGCILAANFIGPADPVEVKETVQGVLGSLYHGEWEKVPDLSKLEPVSTGIFKSMSTSASGKRKDNFALKFEGLFKIDEAGPYRIDLNSDDGAKLYINDNLMLDNDGLHGMDQNRNCTIPLLKGYYRIRVEMFERGGGEGLKVQITPPSGKRREMGTNDLFMDKTVVDKLAKKEEEAALKEGKEPIKHPTNF
ncbi:MAG: hypothetical protein JXR97_08630, partial [Planctomycetes bacterium]|nr:hypothetical protein [Planctomycetota bacterium]